MRIQEVLDAKVGAAVILVDRKQLEAWNLELMKLWEAYNTVNNMNQVLREFPKGSL